MAEDQSGDPGKITEKVILNEKGQQVGTHIIPPGHEAGITLEDEDDTPEMRNLVQALIKNPGARSLGEGEKK